MEIFNEAGILITTASVFGFTDAFESLEQKKVADYFACGVVFCIIIGNLTSLCLTSFRSLRSYFRKLAA